MAEDLFRNRYERAALKEHRARCRNAGKLVDNNAPKMVATLPKMDANAKRLDQITAENKRMIQNICVIWRSQAITDTYLPRVLWETKYLERVSRMALTEALNIPVLLFIQTAVPLVPTRVECHQFWKRAVRKMSIDCRFPLIFIKSKGDPPLPMKNPPPVDDDAEPRKIAFMDFTNEEDRFLGRLEIELFEEQAPNTVANFLAYIRGESAPSEVEPGQEETQPLSYRGTPLHRILPGYFCVGGDVTKYNGTGGASIFGEAIPEEKNELEHIEPGLLCTLEGPADSKFMITMKPLHTLVGRSTVYGRVVKGLDTLLGISSHGASVSGMPIQMVRCTDCGELPPRKKPKKPKKPKTHKARKKPKATADEPETQAEPPEPAEPAEPAERRARNFSP